MEGYYGGDHDDVYDFEPAEYAALDDKMAYLTRGSSGVTYIGHHYYPGWKGVEDFLILNNHKENLTLRAGEELAPFVLVFLPNRTAEEAKKKNEAFQVAQSSAAGVDAVVLEHTLVYSNTQYESVSAAFSFRPQAGVIPVYEGASSLSGGVLSWNTRIPRRECGFAEAKLLLHMDAPENVRLRLFLTPFGELTILNEGDAAAPFQLGGKRFLAEPGRPLLIGS